MSVVSVAAAKLKQFFQAAVHEFSLSFVKQSTDETDLDTSHCNL